MSDDRRKRDLELLMKSRQAMKDEQLAGGSSSSPDRDDSGAQDDGGEVQMYRGRPVRRGGKGPKVPGAGGGRPRQFRGAKPSSGDTDIKSVLKRLDELHREGLITKSEYDKKRLQILDRL